MKQVSDLLSEVRNYWEKAPCGTEDPRLEQALGQEKYTRRYFDQLESIRYQQEPMILSSADFSRHRGKRVLEVGVGAGTDHLQWARAGTDLYGVDLTEAAIETTRQRLGLYGFSSHLQRANAENLPFEKDSFDVAYSWGVIHHSEDPQKIVDEIHRILKPGGQAITMFYARHSIRVYKLWLKHSLLKGKPWKTLAQTMWDHMESIGTKSYTPAELRKMFSGFSRVEVQKYITPYDLSWIPKSLHSWAPDRLGFFTVVKATK